MFKIIKTILYLQQRNKFSMNKIFTFLVVSFAFTIEVSAQKNLEVTKSIVLPQKSTFSGKITDAKTGLPLQGASVYFSDLKTGAVSLFFV